MKDVSNKQIIEVPETWANFKNIILEWARCSKTDIESKSHKEKGMLIWTHTHTHTILNSYIGNYHTVF